MEPVTSTIAFVFFLVTCFFLIEKIIYSIMTCPVYNLSSIKVSEFDSIFYDVCLKNL